MTFGIMTEKLRPIKLITQMLIIIRFVYELFFIFVSVSLKHY